jgi:L-2,4-diaminobutyrate decarboxylase
MATLLELKLLDWLADLSGLPRDTFGGTITSGGTMSNYFACLLALHSYLKKRHGWDAREQGLPPHLLGKLFILTSEIAHFSVEKSALQLGIGTKSVVKVPVDPVTFQMDPAAASKVASDLIASGNHPFLIVGTASTTDFGSFDPLEHLADLAATYSMWFHVDAAYGSACLLSPALRPNLTGSHLAHSVTIDFHKAFFQPISCGALLIRDKSNFDYATVYSDYLNSESRRDEGIPDLVNWSLMTTRRFDAAKMIASIAEVGVEELGKMVERLWELAVWCCGEMRRRKEVDGRKGDLVPLHEPAFGCLVFRYIPRGLTDEDKVDQLNAAIPQVLFERGTAVIGHTKVGGREALKFTVNNPALLEEDFGRLMDVVEACAEELIM